VKQPAPHGALLLKPNQDLTAPGERQNMISTSLNVFTAVSAKRLAQLMLLLKVLTLTLLLLGEKN
jgi:hypothetical protein